MKKVWAWLIGLVINLSILLGVVKHQRDRARQKANRLQAEVEAQKAIVESERRIAKAQREAQLKAQQVEDELNQNRDQRPVDNFGDSRIRLRQQRKD